ncbi:hypothetical protein DFJ77DRAFT_471915 [Powellomyces hirtus]|nr:hypothetical protein DFJ77DRAFT_471915 [Powellomyces hirtus]
MDKGLLLLCCLDLLTIWSPQGGRKGNLQSLVDLGILSKRIDVSSVWCRRQIAAATFEKAETSILGANGNGEQCSFPFGLKRFFFAQPSAT